MCVCVCVCICVCVCLCVCVCDCVCVYIYIYIYIERERERERERESDRHTHTHTPDIIPTITGCVTPAVEYWLDEINVLFKTFNEFLNYYYNYVLLLIQRSISSLVIWVDLYHRRTGSCFVCEGGAGGGGWVEVDIWPNLKKLPQANNNVCSHLHLRPLHVFKSNDIRLQGQLYHRWYRTASQTEYYISVDKYLAVIQYTLFAGIDNPLLVAVERLIECL